MHHGLQEKKKKLKPQERGLEILKSLNESLPRLCHSSLVNCLPLWAIRWQCHFARLCTWPMWYFLKPLAYKSSTDLTSNHLFNSFLCNKFRKPFIRDGEEARHIHIASLSQGLDGVWVFIEFEDPLEKMQQSCTVRFPSLGMVGKSGRSRPQIKAGYSRQLYERSSKAMLFLTITILFYCLA